MTLTQHAKNRMSDRCITLQDIYITVKQGTLSPAKNGLVRYTYNNIYVILDQTTNSVVTVCFIKSYTRQIERHAKQQNIGFYQAVKQLRRLAC